MKCILLCLLVAIITVLIMMICFYIKYEKNITGLWISSGDFNKDSNAGPNGINIYIGEPKLNKNKIVRWAVLTMPDCDIVEKIKISYVPRPILFKSGEMIKIYGHSNSKVFSNNIILEFNIMKNMLRIYDDNILYGVFFKDNEFLELNS